MPSLSTLSSKDKEVLERIIRDIVAGVDLGILKADEANNLTRQTYWAIGNPLEWTALKTFHSARGGFAKFFESKETTERLPYLRSSYLKMLTHTNTRPESNWNYTTATAWKEALLNNYAGFISGKRLQDLQRLFSKTFIYIPISGRSQEREKRGDVGGVRLFTWQRLLWAFKPEENDCKLTKANESGIPKTKARMHNRSVASYLLAKAMGLQRIMVQTEFAYYQGARGLETGILMAGASGAETQKMLPDLRVLCAMSQGVDDIGTITQNFGYSIKPHQRRDLTIASFMKLPVATDLFAANWLDYIAAQMDRHLNNIYFEFSSAGNYEGLKLIDNDMAFGTVTDPVRLREIHGSQNCGIPDCIPPGLESRIRSFVQAVPDSAVFWDQCRSGDPVAPRAPQIRDASPAPVRVQAAQPHGQQHGSLLMERGPVLPRSEPRADLLQPVQNARSGRVQGSAPQATQNHLEPDALACMVEIARLLSKDEFNSLMRRMSLAAQRAGLALPLNTGIVAMVGKEYTTAATKAASSTCTPADREKKAQLDDRSYWHRLLCAYGPGSGLKKEYDNPPKSAEEWIRGGRRGQ